MQVLKPEIRARILSEAETLFYRHDYQKTSMRMIAKAVEISVSNLYKYFENKAAIFDTLIGSYYHDYKKGMERFIRQSKSEPLDSKKGAKISDIIFGSIKRDRIKFVLLMRKSNGTPYAGFKEEIIALFKTHLAAVADNRTGNDYVLALFASNFFYNIVEIATHYKSGEWAYESINTLVTYHINGMKGIV